MNFRIFKRTKLLVIQTTRLLNWLINRAMLSRLNNLARQLQRAARQLQRAQHLSANSRQNARIDPSNGAIPPFWRMTILPILNGRNPLLPCVPSYRKIPWLCIRSKMTSFCREGPRSLQIKQLSSFQRKWHWSFQRKGLSG